MELNTKHIHYLAYRKKNKKGTMSHKLFNTCLIYSPTSVTAKSRKIPKYKESTLNSEAKEKIIIIKMRNKIKKIKTEPNNKKLQSANLRNNSIRNQKVSSPIPSHIKKLINLDSFSQNNINNFSDFKASPTHKTINKSSAFSFF